MIKLTKHNNTIEEDITIYVKYGNVYDVISQHGLPNIKVAIVDYDNHDSFGNKFSKEYYDI